MTKTSSDQLKRNLLQKCLYFDILTISPISNLGSLLLTFLLESIQLCYDIYYYIFWLYYLIYQYIHFLILKSCTYKFYFLGYWWIFQLMNFSLLCFEYISMSFLSSHDLIDVLQNSLPLWFDILFGLHFDLSKMFWKVIVNHFLSFKGKTHAYLL